MQKAVLVHKKASVEHADTGLVIGQKRCIGLLDKVVIRENLMKEINLVR
jgi:hypothetical protein